MKVSFNTFSAIQPIPAVRPVRVATSVIVFTSHVGAKPPPKCFMKAIFVLSYISKPSSFPLGRCDKMSDYDVIIDDVT